MTIERLQKISLGQLILRLKNTQIGLQIVFSRGTLTGSQEGFEIESLKPSLVILFKNIINLFLTSVEDKEKLAELEICLEIITSQEDRDSLNWKERIHR